MKEKMVWAVCGVYIVFMSVVAIYYAMNGSGEKILIALSGVICGFVPLLLGRLAKFHLPLSLVIFYIIFLFGSQYLGSLMDWYRFGWWDIELHFMSGIFLGFVAFALYKHFVHQSVRVAPFLLFLFSLSFVTLGAVMWEIFEFLCDQWFDMALQGGGNVDTMEDLIANAVGGLLVAIWIWIKSSRER